MFELVSSFLSFHTLLYVCMVVCHKKHYLLNTQLKYASTTDCVYFSVGIVGAIFSGVGWPGLNILFGKVVHSFVEYEKNRASHGNDSAEVEIITEEFRAETYLYGGIMAAITVLYIIGNYTAIHCFQMFALRLMREIKKRYFASILKQEIAWFDTQNSGEFASRISRYCSLFTFKKHQQLFHHLF